MKKKMVLAIIVGVIFAIMLPFATVAEGVVKTMGISSDANFGGIFNSLDGKYRFISVLLDTDICPGKKDVTNIQVNDDALGKSVKANIVLDGKNITDWIKAGSGNLYAVMVHYIYMATPDVSGYKGQIALWVNPADESGPMLERDEFHTLEILGSLLSPDGKNIEAVKYLYNPTSKSWSKVENFDGVSVGGATTSSSKASTTSSSSSSSVSSEDSSVSDTSSETSRISSASSSKDETPVEKSEFPLWAVILITGVGTCGLMVGGYFIYKKVNAPK